MQIRVASEADEQVWDEYVIRHPKGLAYHKFAWRQAVKNAYKYDACYLLAEQHGVVNGVFPLILFRTPFFRKKYVSLPFCDIGGVLAEDEIIAKKLEEKAIELGRENGIDGIEVRKDLGTGESGATTTEYSKVRMILALPNSSEKLLAGLKAKVRSQVKKPERDGLSARLGGLELLDDFYAIFARNMRELGSPVHSRRWIQAVIQCYGKQARIGVVYTHEGIATAAGVILMHPSTVSIPWASSLRFWNRLNPNMLLYWTFLSFAADNGYSFFDFGRSSPGGGTYKFKQQWGAIQSPLLWTDLLQNQRMQPLTKHLQLRSVFERVWSKLPFRLTTAIGPYLRRYIPL